MIIRIKRVYQTYGGLFLLGITGIPIGAVIGLMDTIFGKVLLKITDIRETYPMYLIPFLAVVGIVIAYCYLKYGGKSSKGMNLIFEVGHGEEEIIPLRLVPFIISGTWLTHLFGGSAGREGVAVQIGATFSHWIGKKLPIKNASSIFLVTGMAAGFAGLFGTPISAILFAMEVLVAGSLEYKSLLPALTASFTASTVSKALGLEKFSFALSSKIVFDLAIFWKLIALGIIFGMVGGAFAWCLKLSKRRLGNRLKNPIIRIAVAGACLSVLFLLFYKGRYSGLGTNLIQNSFYGGEIYSFDWLLKFILTILTLSAGFQGGEVTPLFSIGASLGVLLAGFFNLPIELVASLGYISVFGSATNTFFAPVFIGAEVFGYSYLPYFFVVCAISYVFNMDKSIYSLQKISGK
ncbi:chloride channel protein [Clostridioides sp. ES-S-0108-01]|uniref:chloride channel protein n=1 Tax=Clostridioides sp. ES-S-0108-01 TaxID=2770773 RepID=UPI001D0C2CFE|nr:chloride channel protein [Clostridioides sp. ES-S-0108-01]UDN51740.1 chloride channel protein [Clostridioides sp. ES-S-0107-01]